MSELPPIVVPGGRNGMLPLRLGQHRPADRRAARGPNYQGRRCILREVRQ